MHTGVKHCHVLWRGEREKGLIYVRQLVWGRQVAIPLFLILIKLYCPPSLPSYGT